MALQLFKIAEVTVASPQSSVTFSSIPQGYTDLKIVVSARSTYDGSGGGSNLRDNLNFYFNGLSASGNWSGVSLYGIPGVVTGSGSGTAGDNGSAGYSNGAGNTANSFGSCQIYIPNYTSTSRNKSVSSEGISESNDTSTGLQLNANLWADNSAITSVTLFSSNPGSVNLVSNSTFTLYGIL